MLDGSSVITSALSDTTENMRVSKDPLINDCEELYFHLLSDVSSDNYMY